MWENFITIKTRNKLDVWEFEENRPTEIVISGIIELFSNWHGRIRVKNYRIEFI